MRQLRRTTAIVSLTLLLQPLLLASVGGCGARSAPDGGAADAGATHSMLSMTGDATMVMDEGAPAPTEPSDSPLLPCDTDDLNRSCGGPDMPPGCAAMSTCGLAPMVSVAFSPATSARADRAHTAEPLALAVGIAESPEAPPPRA